MTWWVLSGMRALVWNARHSSPPRSPRGIVSDQIWLANGTLFFNQFLLYFQMRMLFLYPWCSIWQGPTVRALSWRLWWSSGSFHHVPAPSPVIYGSQGTIGINRLCCLRATQSKYQGLHFPGSGHQSWAWKHVHEGHLVSNVLSKDDDETSNDSNITT